MKNLELTNKKMSSREIAHIMQKHHRDIMRAIRKMEPFWEKFNGRKFTLVEYKDKKGEKRPEYQLDKLEALYITSKFDDESRAKLIMRWYDLENKLQELIKSLSTPINGVYPIYQNGVIGYPRKEQLLSVGRSINNGYRLLHRFGKEHCFTIGRTACISAKLSNILSVEYEVKQLKLDLFNPNNQISQ